MSANWNYESGPLSQDNRHPAVTFRSSRFSQPPSTLSMMLVIDYCVHLIKVGILTDVNVLAYLT